MSGKIEYQGNVTGFASQYEGTDISLNDYPGEEGEGHVPDLFDLLVDNLDTTTTRGGDYDFGTLRITIEQVEKPVPPAPAELRVVKPIGYYDEPKCNCVHTDIEKHHPWCAIWGGKRPPEGAV
jgi:hypothetical protein